ncbi:transposase [Mesorhizobium sp. M0913]|uniref:transposase n=1 Tax=Mesorhizobium sp. M0913 TaxID=2957026 RepID=UPI0033385226
MEPLTREIKRHTDVVGIFPNDDDIIRLVAAIVLEQSDDMGSPARAIHDIEKCRACTAAC